MGRFDNIPDFVPSLRKSRDSSAEGNAKDVEQIATTAPESTEVPETEITEKNITKVEAEAKKTDEVVVLEETATEVEVERERRSKELSKRVCLPEVQDKEKGIASPRDKKKQKKEAHEKVNADLAAGKVPPFQIGGTSKNPPANSPIAGHSVGRALPPPRSDLLRKRSADERASSAKRHQSEDPITDGRRSSRRSGNDISWSYNYHSTTSPITSERHAAAELIRKAGGPTHFLLEVPNLECSEEYVNLALGLVRVCSCYLYFLSAISMFS